MECAGQHLTLQGWVREINKAESSGDMTRGAMYRDNLKAEKQRMKKYTTT